MGEPIESVYFNWLCAKVMLLENPTPSLTFWKLLRKLHSTEFVWLIPNDDNRVEDGLELRHEFVREMNIEVDPEWSKLDCSILEMLIAFSRRAEFQTDISAKDWFWMFMEHLRLADCNDASDVNPSVIDEILYQFVWRTYDYNGVGGLFPLHETNHDQRKVEVWYQFCEFLVDQERL